MLDLASRAFEEDRRIIEAQQRNLKLRPEPDSIMIGHDRGPSMFRAVMERLIKAEADTLRHGMSPDTVQGGMHDASVLSHRL